METCSDSGCHVNVERNEKCVGVVLTVL